MRSNFKYILLIFICSLLTLKNVNAEEPFVFDVTEIEILENGDQINGYKGGTAVAEDGSKITAENFLYNKLTNILEAIGNVKYFNETKNIIITSDKVIYFKNKEYSKKKFIKVNASEFWTKTSPYMMGKSPN